MVDNMLRIKYKTNKEKQSFEIVSLELIIYTKQIMYNSKTNEKKGGKRPGSFLDRNTRER